MSTEELMVIAQLWSSFLRCFYKHSGPGSTLAVDVAAAVGSSQGKEEEEEVRVINLPAITAATN